MGNKYYTPELSEFYVGFEYEIMIPEFSRWSKEIFHLNESHIDLIKYVNIQDEFTKNKIRVKYLDNQDLEDCGFECYEDVVISDDGHVFGKFKKLTRNNALWKIHFFGSFTQLKIECFQDTSLSIREKPMKEWDFTADMMVIIKNKSELKKILKQLGI